MLKPGDLAPEFVLPDENGDEVSLTQLLQLQHRWGQRYAPAAR